VNRVFKIIAALAIIIIVPKAITKLMLPKQKPASELIVTMVKDINAQLPRDLGSGTTLTKVDFDGSTVHYFYTLSGVSAQLAATQEDTVKRNMKTFACADPAREILRQGFAMTFTTSYTEGRVQQSFDTRVEPGQCS